jgi:hypothetical protein
MENKTMTNELTTVKRIKRITSHVGLSRYMASLDTTMWVTPRIAAIPSPYAYSPTHIVYRENYENKGMYGSFSRNVIIVETKHKQYDVFDASNLPLQLAEFGTLLEVL